MALYWGLAILSGGKATRQRIQVAHETPQTLITTTVSAWNDDNAMQLGSALAY
jgi:uncharacterized BrkB/YihY/UPF0761 family membrane protein